MTPLYFLPGKSRHEADRRALLQTPLASAFRDCLDSDQNYHDLVIKSDCKYGPTKTSGLLVSASPNGTDPIVLYKPEEQRWVNFGDYWIGVFVDNMPTPAELKRKHQISGFEETLGDGNVWNCPVIRTPLYDIPKMRVPIEFGVNDQGEFIAEPMAEYVAAWEASATVWDTLIGKASTNLAEGIELAAQFLNLNYRVSKNECLLLKLINEPTLERIFVAACDREFCDQVVDELEKKRS